MSDGHSDWVVWNDQYHELQKRAAQQIEKVKIMHRDKEIDIDELLIVLDNKTTPMVTALKLLIKKGLI